MPWIGFVCLLVVGGCFFEADYSGGMYTCRDGKCPSGMDCVNQVCVPERRDAAVDTPMVDAIDARIASLTCGDPGVLASGVKVTGTTEGRPFNVSAMCNATIMNGRDAVYRITTTASATLLVEINGSLNAYVVTACASTPMCIGGTAAAAGSAINVSATTPGNYFVVVDNLNAGVTGIYDLTVTIN